MKYFPPAIIHLSVTQHTQVFSLFFRNRIQSIALYQLHNSEALVNLRRGYFTLFGSMDGKWNKRLYTGDESVCFDFSYCIWICGSKDKINGNTHMMR